MEKTCLTCKRWTAPVFYNAAGVCDGISSTGDKHPHTIIGKKDLHIELISWKQAVHTPHNFGCIYYEEDIEKVEILTSGDKEKIRSLYQETNEEKIKNNIAGIMYLPNKLP